MFVKYCLFCFIPSLYIRLAARPGYILLPHYNKKYIFEKLAAAVGAVAYKSLESLDKQSLFRRSWSNATPTIPWHTLQLSQIPAECHASYCRAAQTKCTFVP